MRKNFYESKYKNKRIAYRYGLAFNSPYGYLGYNFKHNVGFVFGKKLLFYRPVSRKTFKTNFGGF